VAIFGLLKQAVDVLGQEYHRLSEDLASFEASSVGTNGACRQMDTAGSEDLDPFLRRLAVVKDDRCHGLAFRMALPLVTIA